MSTSATSNATSQRVTASRALAATCALLAILVGCGESEPTYPSARVTGRVTIDGEPVVTGSVNFYPQQSGQGPTVSAEIVDGVYTAEQVPMGDVLVQLMATRETGRMIPGSSSEVPEVLSIIPAEYQSGVTLSVTGDSEHDFELTSQP